MNSEIPSETPAWDANLDELLERARQAVTPKQAAILDERLGQIRATVAEASAEPGALNGVAASVAKDVYRA